MKGDFREWLWDNGCLLTIIIVIVIVLLIAGIKNGISGIGSVFAFLAILGVGSSIGKGDLGCGFRITLLIIGGILGLISYGLISWEEELTSKDKVENAIESLPQNPSVSDHQRLADKPKSFEDWGKYQNAVPSDEYRDIQEKKDAFDTRWATDKSAWQTASELNNISSYQKYLELYPNGRYNSEAESKLIDLQVDATFAGNHGYLPEMDKTSHSGGATSYIKVHNNTSYTLTLLYSGKESKKLVLSPHSRGNLQLKNGSYRIAAFVTASNVQRYAGNETVTGGSYEVEYYISTTTVPSYYKY